MAGYKIPFSGRAHSYTEDEVSVVTTVMQNAVPLTQGTYLKKFEDKLCQYIDSDYAFAVNNATAALELTAQLCQFNLGDEVIIPSHTFTATAYPFLKNGAEIVWADIDLKTRVVTAETIKQKLTSKTKAIVVVHLYGYGAEMEEIIKLANEHDLLVIEDAAQALGVKVDGQSVGTFGDFGVFSFHSHKNITTLGEGGMLVVKNKQIAEIIPMLRHNGHCDFNYKREHYWIPAMGNVDLPEINGEKLWPNNYCLGEVECALGLKLLDRIDQINVDKRQRAKQFIEAVGCFGGLEFHKEYTDRHNYHLLVALVKNGKRDAIMARMSEEGVQCVVQYCPLNRYDLYIKAGFGDADCSKADHFFDNMISFPFHHMMSEDSFDEMIAITKIVLSEF